MPPARPGFSLGRLPVPGQVFVGREPDLRRLDTAWAEPGVHVIVLVASGGAGKSALAARWLDRLAAAGWPGVERAFDWSFPGQGRDERMTSSEPFLAAALRFFGDPDPHAGALHERGARLAGLIRQRPTLLILDGVEPLLHPPGPMAGRLKDQGLAALLKGLAAGHPGLCVATTRERIADLDRFAETAPQVALADLGVEDGVELLKRLGVNGREEELRAAVAEVGGHALTASLLGSYLGRAHGGDVRRRREIGLGAAGEERGAQASRVIAAHAAWLGEGPELAVLRLLGLFDRPAETGELAALRAAPAIPGLTDRLFQRQAWWRRRAPISDEEWRSAVARLREHGLLAGEGEDGGRLDSHPAVRAHFAAELAERRPRGWRQGHRRLYEHLCRAAPELPDTPEEVQPLVAAVVHGCRAGRVREALHVCLRRILQENISVDSRRVGSLGSELTALAAFFERPWTRPSARLRPRDRFHVQNAAIARLRAVGRLAEAVELAQAWLDRYIVEEAGQKAAISAGNLSELALVFGEVAQAEELGGRCIELADRVGTDRPRFDSSYRYEAWTIWADALHQAGRREESAAVFREADTEQAERWPESPRLDAMEGLRYCDLLLGQAEPEDGAGLDGLTAGHQAAERFQAVVERGTQLLENRDSAFGPGLCHALVHLTLGRAHHGLARTAQAGQEGDAAASAAEHLDQAVAVLQRSDNGLHLPRAFLARAAWRRFRRDFDAAEADLAEALELAERGSLRLCECDAHLELWRLRRDQGRSGEARRHLERARALVAETGYLRRSREVEWGLRQLGE